MKSALALLLLGWAPTACFADHDANVRFAAHFGVSYAIDDVTYRVARSGMSELQAQMLAAATTLFIGVVYKTLENASGPEMVRSTLENAVGVGAASVVHWQFKF